jgi:single-strand DNA-binding protein
MINKTILVGRITKDVELKYTQTNIAYTRFTLAVNRTYTESNGERKADFIQCVAWRNQAENMAKYISKGSLLGIEGRIQTGSYDDPSGVRRYTTDVVCDSVQFLEPKNAQNNQEFNDNGYYRQDYEQPKKQQPKKQQQRTPEIDVAEDDLPF